MAVYAGPMNYPSLGIIILACKRVRGSNKVGINNVDMSDYITVLNIV